MATYNAADMTSGAAVQEHPTAINVAIPASYTQSATISAVGQINICKVPKGAQVVGGYLKIAGVPGTGLAVKDNEGNYYLATSTPTAQLNTAFNGSGLGTRITGSAHIAIEQNGLIAAQAGADSCTYSLIVEYLTRKDGD